MTTALSALDLGVEEAEAFDAPEDSVWHFIAGVAVGVAAGVAVVAIAT